MKIVIAGAGEVGTHLAKMLSQENQDIVLMDPKEERLSTMSSTLEILPVVGDVGDPSGCRQSYFPERPGRSRNP